MNTMSIINDLKIFLEKYVANDIELKCSDDDNAYNFSLVHPSVFIGWIPPKGFLPEVIESAIPCIMVGLDNGTDDSRESSFKIKLSMATWSPGEYQKENQEEKLIPSFNGYVDLINLLDKTKAVLLKNLIISEKYIIDGDVSYGMYNEQPYPYWYGYMTFSIKAKAYPNTEINKLL